MARFYVCDGATLLAGASRQVQIESPAQRRTVYLTATVQASATCAATISELSDRTTGTALTILPVDRTSSATSLSTASHTPTGGSSDGTVISSLAVNAGEGTLVEGLRLKRNRKYIVSITADAGGSGAVVSSACVLDELFSFATTTTSSTSSTTTA